MELTILMPCLNEEETIGICIKKAQRFLTENKIDGEVIIADNGSEDNSLSIIKKTGVRLQKVKKKGYGNALREGTKVAKGKYVIMGDADDSYNFLEILPILTKLREGYDIVIGNRYLGKMEKHAMKLSHKYIGTPIISYIGKKKFGVQVNDFNCGLRGYNNEAIMALNCEAEGMEYASEMLIKASQNKLKICEVPINFYQDGRKKKPHLKTIRDGIRHFHILLRNKNTNQ